MSGGGRLKSTGGLWQRRHDTRAQDDFAPFHQRMTRRWRPAWLRLLRRRKVRRRCRLDLDRGAVVAFRVLGIPPYASFESVGMLADSAGGAAATPVMSPGKADFAVVRSALTSPYVKAGRYGRTSCSSDLGLAVF